MNRFRRKSGGADPSEAAWAAWEVTRGECAAGRHQWGPWRECRCRGMLAGHRLGSEGACDVIVCGCAAVACREHQERQPLTPDPVSNVVTELVWYLAARADLPAMLGEHTADAGGQCAGCARYGRYRGRPCGVYHILRIALALRASDLFARVTERPWAERRLPTRHVQRVGYSDSSPANS